MAQPLNGNEQQPLNSVMILTWVMLILELKERSNEIYSRKKILVPIYGGYINQTVFCG